MNDLYQLTQVNIALLREPIRAHGPTPIAFTIKHRFSPPASEAVADNNDDWLYPA